MEMWWKQVEMTWKSPGNRWKSPGNHLEIADLLVFAKFAYCFCWFLAKLFPYNRLLRIAGVWGLLLLACTFST
jgi:hypothetical protein